MEKSSMLFPRAKRVCIAVLQSAWSRIPLSVHSEKMSNQKPLLSNILMLGVPKVKANKPLFFSFFLFSFLLKGYFAKSLDLSIFRVPKLDKIEATNFAVILQCVNKRVGERQRGCRRRRRKNYPSSPLRARMMSRTSAMELASYFAILRWAADSK